MPRQSTSIAREIRSIKLSFNKLARSFGRIAPLLSVAATSGSDPDTAGGKRPRRKPRLTSQQREALKLQGKYMGTMRGLKPTQRAKIKKIRATKGIRAAIAAAQKLSQ